MPKKKPIKICRVCFRPDEDIEKMIHLALVELGWSKTKLMNVCVKAYLATRYAKHLKF